MRVVELCYRVHMTSLLRGKQWYSGQHIAAPAGWLFDEREEAEAWARRVSTRTCVADVEEYEIQPVNEENTK